MAEKIPWAHLGHKDLASALIADPLQGGLWLGFIYGGVSYFKDGQIREAYSGSDGLGEGRINTLRVDADGALWAATDGGLSRIKKGRIATLTSKNGLPCDTVHWSMEDDAGSVWLYMPCGLVRVARAELGEWATTADKDKGGDAKRIQATVFDTSDGVRTRGAGYGYGALVAKALDGKLWFAAPDGVSVFDPNRLPLNKIPPSVHIEQITADRKSYWQNWSGNVFLCRLPPLVRDLRLIPRAGLWSRTVYPTSWMAGIAIGGPARGGKTFSDLAPQYRFRVMACNNSGVERGGRPLDFRARRFYQTNWFRAACVAAFLATSGASQLRLRRGAQFNCRKKRVGERTRIWDFTIRWFHGLCCISGGDGCCRASGRSADDTGSAIDQALRLLRRAGPWGLRSRRW